MRAGGDFGDRQHPQVCQVRQQVDRNHHPHAHRQRQQNIARRIANFPRNRAHLRPSVVGKQAGNQSHSEAAQLHRRPGRGRRGGRMSEHERAADNHQNPDKFRRRENFLHQRAPRHAAVIHHREHSQSRQGDHFRRHRSQGMEIGNIQAEHHAQPCHLRRSRDQKNGPAAQKSGHRSKGFAQENVHASGSGHGRAQLRDGQRAEKRNHARQKPTRPESPERRSDFARSGWAPERCRHQ